MNKQMAIAAVVAAIAAIMVLSTFPYAEADGETITVDGSDNAALQEAIDKLNDGDILQLTEDIKLKPSIDESAYGSLIATISIDKNITLDLNGRTVAWDRTHTTEDLPNHICLISISSNVTITGNGTIDASADDNSGYGINIIGGDVVVESGTFIGSITAVQVEIGSLTVKEGTFEAYEPMLEKHPGEEKYLINCIDANFNDGTASITLMGGTYGYDFSNDPEGSDTTYIAPGYKSTANGDGTYTVSAITSTEAVANIDDLYFATIEDALAYVKADGTAYVLTLCSNIESSSMILLKQNQNIVMELGGCNISFTGSQGLSNNATLEIYGPGSISIGDAGSSAITNTKYGTLTIGSSVKISGGYQQTIFNNGTMTLSGCEVDSDGIAINTSMESKTTITGGTVITSRATGTMAAVVNSTEMNFDQGSIVSGGVGIGNTGSLTVEDGAIINSTNSCISATAGTTNMKGGSFETDDESCVTVKNDAAVTITGGMFNVVGEIEEYLAEKHKVYQNDDETFRVGLYYTMTFYEEDGVTVMKTIQTNDLGYVDPDDVPMPEMRDGYIFTWFSEGSMWSETTQYGSDCQIYQKWFDPMDGSITMEGETHIGQTVTLSAPEGYDKYAWILTDSLPSTLYGATWIEGPETSVWEALESGCYIVFLVKDDKITDVSYVQLEFTEPTYTIRYFLDGGSEPYYEETLIGGTVPTIPDLPSLPEGYGYLFESEGEWDWSPVPLETNTVVNMFTRITDIDVTISAGVSSDGTPQLVAELDTSVDYAIAECAWTLDLETISGEGWSIPLTSSGSYYVAVYIEDAEGVFGMIDSRFDYTAPAEGGEDFSGGSATVTTDKDTAVITTDTGADGAILDLSYTDSESNKVADITITGNVGQGAVAVTVKPMESDVAKSAVSNVVSEEQASKAVGVDVKVSNVTDYLMTIKVPLDLPEGEYAGSALAYFIEEDGSLTPVDCIVRGTEVWIYTTHNTEYVAVPTSIVSAPVEEEEPVFEDDDTSSDMPPFIPFPPQTDGDPVEVYPSQNGGTSDSRDNTLKIVAVAAAAVIAAILVIVLASTYRHD